MAEICPKCGVRQARPSALGRNADGKNRIVAAILALLLGSFGAHKFYVGKIGQGILYLILCWSFLPTIAGVIEGVIYLAMTDEKFEASVGSKAKSGQLSV